MTNTNSSSPGMPNIGGQPGSSSRVPSENQQPTRPQPRYNTEEDAQPTDFKRVARNRKSSERKGESLPRKVEDRDSPYDPIKRKGSKTKKGGEGKTSLKDETQETSEKMVAPLISQEALESILPEAEEPEAPKSKLEYVVLEEEGDEGKVTMKETKSSKGEQPSTLPKRVEPQLRNSAQKTALPEGKTAEGKTMPQEGGKEIAPTKQMSKREMEVLPTTKQERSDKLPMHKTASATDLPKEDLSTQSYDKTSSQPMREAPKSKTRRNQGPKTNDTLTRANQETNLPSSLPKRAPAKETLRTSLTPPPENLVTKETLFSTKPATTAGEEKQPLVTPEGGKEKTAETFKGEKTTQTFHGYRERTATTEEKPTTSIRREERPLTSETRKPSQTFKGEKSSKAYSSERQAPSQTFEKADNSQISKNEKTTTPLERKTSRQENIPTRQQEATSFDKDQTTTPPRTTSQETTTPRQAISKDSMPKETTSRERIPEQTTSRDDHLTRATDLPKASREEVRATPTQELSSDKPLFKQPSSEHIASSTQQLRKEDQPELFKTSRSDHAPKESSNYQASSTSIPRENQQAAVTNSTSSEKPAVPHKIEREVEREEQPTTPVTRERRTGDATPRRRDASSSQQPSRRDDRPTRGQEITRNSDDRPVTARQPERKERKEAPRQERRDNFSAPTRREEPKTRNDQPSRPQQYAPRQEFSRSEESFSKQAPVEKQKEPEVANVQNEEGNDQAIPGQQKGEVGAAPAAPSMGNAVGEVTSSSGTMASSDIQALVSELVDKLYVMKNDGVTETTITLKNSALFGDATVTVKGYDIAKGEFNISFANLSNQARELLDRQVNQELLKQSMLEKGFTVHIITTTTEKDAPTFSETRQQDAQKEEEQKRQQQDEEREEPEQTFEETHE